MNRLFRLGKILMTLSCFMTLSCYGAANAQTQGWYHTWVSASGSDVDTCGQPTAPCKSLSYGIGKTIPGGQVECFGDVIAGGFFTITKSITVSCDTARWSNWLAVNTWYDSLTINVAASDLVVLRGLRLSQNPNSGSSALIFSGAGTLVLDNIEVTNFSINGILFQPNGAGRLVVSNSLFAGNGDFQDNTGAAIRIAPRPGGSAQVSVNRVLFDRNVFGLAADGSNSTAGINVTVTDSVASSNAQDGFIAVSSNAPAGMMVANSKSLNNGFGVRSIGPNVTVRVKNSEIIGNGAGLGGGGALLSAGDNTVQANGANGSFTGSYAKQ